MKKVRIGLIGLGARGKFILDNPLCILHNAGEIEISAVCDHYQDRVDESMKFVQEKTGFTPFGTLDYKDILSLDIDAVLITTAWEYHIEIACAAMRAGLQVGMEVGGAYSIEDCWKLVRTHEETGKECMLLENCCYGRRELMALHMVRLGVFGDIVHCSGGYNHDLREEIGYGDINRHYRQRNYLTRNCDNYPTHELGPIMPVLNINHGNRMLTLNSVASCSKGMETYIKEKRPGSFLDGKKFNQGDVVTTIIKCANGETITMTLDTTLPRMYSRGFTVRGTKGMYCMDGDYIHMDGDSEWNTVNDVCGNAEKYADKYEHPIWKEYKNNPTGGHDGIDWLVYNAFFDSVRNQTLPPIDTYDTATLIAISPLSEASVAMDGAPVAIPDFTSGAWQLCLEKPKKCPSQYALFER